MRLPCHDAAVSAVETIAGRVMALQCGLCHEVFIDCPTCGKLRSGPGEGRRIYCDEECARLGRNKNARDRRAMFSKGGPARPVEEEDERQTSIEAAP